MEEVCKVPSGHVTFPYIASFLIVIFTKKLHTHHGKYENNDKQDKSQVGQWPNSVGHDCQNVIQRFPGFGQFENSQEPKGSEHRQAFYAFSQELHQGQDNDDKIKDIPSILSKQKSLVEKYFQNSKNSYAEEISRTHSCQLCEWFHRKYCGEEVVAIDQHSS